MRLLPLLLLVAACSGSHRRSTAVPVASCSITASAAWANAVALPDDPFVNPAGINSVGVNQGVSGWIKFAVLDCDPSTVYFQDTRAYPFHYDFATSELDPFLGMSRAEFDAITLYAADRKAILGAVLLQPQAFRRAGAEELGIQLVGIDAIPRERVADIFRMVKDRIGASPAANVFYFPTFEQQATADENEAFFAAEGVDVSSAERWSAGNVVYSPGWAIGRLKFFPADELDDAYMRGDLALDDVLLTDGVPASVPLVAGIVTLGASSPASHTAILSQTFGVPFGYLADEADGVRAKGLVGRLVALRAYKPFGGDRLEVIDVEDEIDDQLLVEILRLKEPEALELMPVTPLGEIARPVSEVELDDARFVGGKSAGFGTLARSIPDNVPAAVAFSFDLWSGFLDQPGAGGTAASTLRQQIAARLAGHSYPPVDMATLAADLEAVRDLIEDPTRTSFATGHETAVLDTLRDPQHALQSGAKIRFRSSSNMEDAARFTGAGLYSSFSGCLDDELDEDELGPSHCDPDKSTERGVFRAIRKVFASFYDERPFLARLQYGVDESDVGMAVLAHHSFPDEFELANGVATYRKTGNRSYVVEIFAQAGAESVTNPEPGQIPENVGGSSFRSSTVALELRESSNLLPLGAMVMDWSEYQALVQLLDKAADGFVLETGRREFTLEFEFKSLAPGGAALPAGGLAVKQLREIPPADTAKSIVPFVIGSTAKLTTFQGERSNVFSNHRLKVELELETRSGWLDELVAAEDLFAGASMRFTDGCSVREQTFALPASSEAFQQWDGSKFELTLVQTALSNPRTVRIETIPIPPLVSPSESPILIADDFRTPLMEVDHVYPVAIWREYPTYGLEPVLQERVTLTGPRTVAPTDLARTIHAESNGVVADVRLFWPTPPLASAGYTAPLAHWGETVISGLTQDPIVLTGEFSQTYRPGHHNFTEQYLFEPRLEPGISRAALDELETQGIHLILLTVNAGLGREDTITTFSALEAGHRCATGGSGPRTRAVGDEGYRGPLWR